MALSAPRSVNIDTVRRRESESAIHGPGRRPRSSGVAGKACWGASSAYHMGIAWQASGQPDPLLELELAPSIRKPLPGVLNRPDPQTLVRTQRGERQAAASCVSHRSWQQQRASSRFPEHTSCWRGRDRRPLRTASTPPRIRVGGWVGPPFPSRALGLANDRRPDRGQAPTGKAAAPIQRRGGIESVTRAQPGCASQREGVETHRLMASSSPQSSLAREADSAGRAQEETQSEAERDREETERGAREAAEGQRRSQVADETRAHLEKRLREEVEARRKKAEAPHRERNSGAPGVLLRHRRSRSKLRIWRFRA